LTGMRNDKPEEVKPEAPPTDWADLRAQAAKLGVTLSQLQQLHLEKKLRLARKGRAANPPGKDVPFAKP
jgi:hypothetical protein